MAKHKITLVTQNKAHLALLEQELVGLDYEMAVHICSSHGETIEAIKGADLIIVRGVLMPREVIDEIDTAQAILNLGHGFDRIDHNAATDRGIMVVNTAGFVTDEVSNHAIMFLLACAKKLTVLHDQARSGRWASGISAWSMPPIDDQVLGLVGFGNIGRATVRKAKVFGLETIAYDPYVPPWIAKEYSVEIVPSLSELASRSDFVSIHIPLNVETRKLIGEPFFKAMKPKAYLINTSRGATVDEEALTRALDSGEIAGAGLDVFEQEPTPPNNPLLKMDNVLVTPHTAGNSDVSEAASLRSAGQETARILSGTWPMSLVNPEVRAKIPNRPAARQR